MASYWRRIVREAHRRSVWQVLGVYLVGSWFAYQVVLGLHDGLGLPGWVPAMAVVLFVVGLPIVLATAIVEEGPPLRRGADHPHPHPHPHPGPGHSPIPGPHPGPGHAPGPGQPEAPDQPGVADDPALPGQPTVPSHPPDRDHPPAPDPRPAASSRLGFLTWRRSLTAGVVAFALLGVGATAFMAMRNLGIGPAGTLMARGVLDERDLVVLAEFAAPERDAALAGAVAEALRIDLIQSQVIRVVEPGPVRAALERMQHPAGSPVTEEVARQVALREGHKAVIAGDVSSMGTGWMLSARLVAAEDGATLAAFRETARDSAAIIDAVDRLSRQMRERVGESLRSIRASPRLHQVSTHSLPALRSYSEAERLVREAGESLAVVALLEDAVRMDSTFAMGWRRLATVLSNLGFGESARVHALERAYALRDRLPEIERHHANAAYHAWVLEDPDGAIAAYRQILALDPDDSIALNNLSLQLMQLRQLSEAEPILRRATTTDGSHTPWINLVATLVALDRLDDARATYAHALERFPDHASVLQLAPALAVAGGRWDQVDSIARGRQDRLPESPFVQATARMDRMEAAALHGRLREFASLRVEVDGIAQRLDLVPQRLQLALWDAGAFAFVRGDADEALRRVEDALARYPLESIDPFDRPHLTLARLYAAAGRIDHAQAMIEADQATAPAGRRPTPELVRMQGYVQLRAGDGEAALETFRRAVHMGGCTMCGLDHLGAAFETVGLPDSARVAYERYLTAPFLGRKTVESMHRPAILVRAAELHEEAGDLELARQRYAEFLRLWEHADPELQPRVEAVRRRLAAREG